MGARRILTAAWWLLALAGVALIIAVVADRLRGSEADSVVAPAFSADDLARQPTDGWLTNGGTLANQRFSPLDEIDTETVADLKGVWRTELGDATAAKYSAEAQPIAYKGVLYVPTGDDDVFAVSVETGRILWRYDSNIDQSINTVCCGWLSRGVALGDGKVFIGQLDGALVALDQGSGRVVWKVAAGDWRKGETITSAPLFYDGLVITGLSGGEFSIRGRVQAFAAEDGRKVWEFHTIPGPGERGHDSWPSSTDAWRHGGAPVWQTPAVDPDLGLLYFSTGNASPDLDGSRREGDNLYAASIVALDTKTGQYRWHFQQVHHDIWDYDGPSPIVLFDASFEGSSRTALAQTSKTGWTYVLDRKTGKPLLPIVEREVPQDGAQATSLTQPIPQYDPFFPHDVTAADVASIEKLARSRKSKANVVGGHIYQPFGREIRVISPGPQGGVNWQPTSYNPDTGFLYICGMRSVSGYSRNGDLLAESKRGRTADLGSVFTTTGFGNQTGYFGAWDPVAARVVWRHRWPESCYSGTVTTAGNLVFVGRNAGELEAYDARSGERKWRFQTGAGANSTPTVFEHDGREMIAFFAGGNALAASPHGASLWLFSLDGKMGPAAAPSGGGSGTGHAGEAPEKPTGTGQANATAGKVVFAQNCAGCHGELGTGGNGGPSLVGVDGLTRIRAQVTNGGGGMPAFKGQLSPEQIRDVAEYVRTRVARSGR